MNRMPQSLCIICLFALCLASACKKSTGSKTTCTSTLYGISAPSSSTIDTGISCIFGTINPTTGVISTLGTLFSHGATNQGTYNSSDNCYYIFRYGYTLYKVAASGSVTSLTPSGASSYSSPVYNSVTNNLYCISGGNLAQISISGTTFLTTVLATPVHPFRGYLTVDNNTGTIYFASGDTVNNYIEKYTPGSSATSVVASVTGVWDFLGMKFNKNDNLLYAIRENYPAGGQDFVKIDPVSGSVTTISIIATPAESGVNIDFYSTCIDPCTNHYYISTGDGVTGILNQYSMTGTLMTTSFTTNILQGMTVN